MLVIGRKTQEAVVFETTDGPIEVTLKICGSRTRLLITAPENVRVLRSELLGRERKQREPAA